MPGLDQLFPIILIGGMVVFMVFSGRKRKAQAAEMATKVLPGAKVMLTSGIYGKVVSVSDDRVIVASASSTLEVAKGAVVRVVENAPEKKSVAAKAAPKATAVKKPVAKKPVAKK